MTASTSTERNQPAVATTVAQLRALLTDSKPASGTGTPAGAGPAADSTANQDTRAQVNPARTRAVVMTMGALHEGHLELVRAAKAAADQVVVTIFVNPLQFGPGEDYEAYPRTLEADLVLLAGAGVDVVFAPTGTEMYPDGHPLVSVSAGRLGTILEGAVRPGHFDGMLTVVLKLLNLTAPDLAFFGQKDAQQLLLIERMVADLDLAVEIRPVPIVRQADGLALSSRNAYLSEAERGSALALSAALTAARAAGASGATAEGARQAALDVLASHPEITTDYLVVVDPRTITDAGPDFTGGALALVAARVGSTRLIDNMFVEIGGQQSS